jgi:hypothetical protein
MVNDDPRIALEKLIAEHREDYAGLSKLVGRNAAYIQQYLKRGSPKHLPERERGILARYFGVDERILGGLSEVARRSGLVTIRKLNVGASAGPGALNDIESLAGKIGFDEKWLRRIGVDPAKLSLIRVEGESMAPTLNDGDDIMVDSSAAASPLRDGIHVIRFDEALMVKRLARGPGGRLSVISDNPAFPDWPDVDQSALTIVGRVVWAARRL